MPIIKSAKKRVRVNRKAAVRNSKTKRSLKTALKAFVAKPSADSHAAVQSNVDKAVKKGLVHKNKAARMKSKLAKQAKAAGAKPLAAKKTTAAKKPAAKAAPARKTAAKKAAAKKPASKK